MENISELKGLIRRRIKIFLLSSIPVFIIVVIVAFTLPPIYVSKSTILVESQQIPQEYVKSTVTGYVEQRLQSITQQILSRSNLIKIINQFNLYPDMGEKYATEVVLTKMRKDIILETIQAGGRGSRDATIAFTLSYEGKDPTTVQKVANVIASLYLEENLKKREAQATRTTEFLQQELNHLKEQINGYGSKISKFKEAHLGELPEYNTINVRAMDQLSRDIDQANMQLSSLKERKVYLEGQIANVDLSGPVVTAGGTIVSGETQEERLNSLRLQLINLQTSLSDKHPDIVRLKKEVHELEAREGETKVSSGDTERLNDLKNRLVTMKTRLGPQHPDVVKISREVASLSREIQNSEKDKAASGLTNQRERSPAYMSLKTQIESINIEINHLFDERIRIKKKMNYYQKKIENAPRVEKEYASLTADYENSKQKYNEVMSKLMEARVSKGMEETQHGERFTIIEPAAKPEAPEKPDRRKIMLMGLFLSLGAGAGLAFVQENMDHSIKKASELDGLGDIPVLSVIPLIESEEEIKRKRKKMIIGGLSAVGVMIAALIVIHIFVMPLDIIWLKIQRKVMIKM